MSVIDLTDIFLPTKENSRAEPCAMTCIRYTNLHASIFVSFINISTTNSLGMYYNSPILQKKKLRRVEHIIPACKTRKSQDLNLVCYLLNTQLYKEEFNLMAKISAKTEKCGEP